MTWRMSRRGWRLGIDCILFRPRRRFRRQRDFVGLDHRRAIDARQRWEFVTEPLERSLLCGRRRGRRGPVRLGRRLAAFRLRSLWERDARGRGRFLRQPVRRWYRRRLPDWRGRRSRCSNRRRLDRTRRPRHGTRHQGALDPLQFADCQTQRNDDEPANGGNSAGNDERIAEGELVDRHARRDKGKPRRSGDGPQHQQKRVHTPVPCPPDAQHLAAANG